MKTGWTKGEAKVFGMAVMAGLTMIANCDSNGDNDAELARDLANAEQVALRWNAHHVLLAVCEHVADMADCEDAADWKDAHKRLTEMAQNAVALVMRAQQ